MTGNDGTMSPSSEDGSGSPPVRRAAVIVPVRNNAEGIERLCGRLLAQRVPPDLGSYEVIVVDNSSTDNTLSVLKRISRQHSGRFRWLSESRPGSYAARNAGIRATRAPILAFTDSDCVPSPEWVREGIGALESTGADMAAGRIRFTFQGERPGICEQFDAARKLDQEYYVRDSNFGATANLFVRRSVFESNGVFREDLRSGGDYEFGQRATGGGATLVYASEAVVDHPARAQVMEILKKTWRVSRGQRKLARLGLLRDHRLSWRNFMPARSFPRMKGINPTIYERAGLWTLANLAKVTNAIARI